MNSADSWGFKPGFQRTQRCSLIEIPCRDLREWVVYLGDGSIGGFVDQKGNSRFMTLNRDTTLIAAYANVEQAVRVVRIANLIWDCFGITCGMFQ
jgi:hypothetical protein